MVSMLQNIGDAVFVTNAEERIVYWNHAAEQLYGIASEDALAKTFADLVPVEKLSLSRAEIERRLSAEGHCRVEALHLDCHGQPVWVDCSITAWGPEGEMQGRISSIRDITAYKQVEETLHQLEDRFRVVAKVSSDLFFEWDAQTNQFRWFGDIDQLLGYEPGEFPRELTPSVIHPNDRRRFLEAILRSIRTGEVFDEEYRLQKKNGDYVVIASRGVAFRDAAGVVRKWIGINTEITERKKAEQTVHESEQRFRVAARVANDLIYERDCRTGLASFYGDPETHRNYGSEDFPRTFSGWAELVHPDDLPRVIDAAKAQFASGALYQVDYRIRKTGGEYLHLLDRAALVMDEAGTPQKWVGILSDITASKAAEEALRKSEEHFRSLIENAADIITVVDQEGLISYCSPAIELYFGYRPDEVLGQNGFAFIYPEDLPKGLKLFADLVQQPGSSLFTELRFVHKDGSYRHLEGVATNLLHNPAVAGIVINTRDVTERKITEEALRTSEERFRIAANITNDIIFERDFRTGVLRFRSDVSAYLGYGPEELPRTMYDFAELIHPDDLSKLLEAVQQNFRTGIPYRVEIRVRKKDGVYAVWISQGTLVRDPTGVPVKWVVVATDITRQKQAETEKAKLEEQLRQSMKMEAIGRLAGGVAHDFNNILTGITGYTQLLLSSVDADDPLRPDMLEIEKAAERAASLTAQLLAFGRQQIITPRVLDLNDLIVRSGNMLKRVIGEDIDFAVAPGKELKRVQADPGQIEQVLVNLAINAREAMPDGGKLTVETMNTRVDQEYCRQHAGVVPGEYVMMAVSDNGCGMNAEVRQHLFEPFYTTKEKGKGAGLGLSSVYGIVQQNNGFINVYSEVGVGTTFKICLPAVIDKAAAVIPPGPPSSVNGTETILLVEDEETVRNLARRILEKHGYQVIAAADGEKACLICKDLTGDVALLLTDVIMPQMNGNQLYEQLKVLRPQLKVLYMSGYAENAIANHGVLDANTQFIRKPFTVDALARRVRAVLDS